MGEITPDDVSTLLTEIDRFLDARA
jgi:hypothetical protein